MARKGCGEQPDDLHDVWDLSQVEGLAIGVVEAEGESLAGADQGLVHDQKLGVWWTDPRTSSRRT